MCDRCGDRAPGRRFAVDGSTAMLCGACVTESIRIAAAHETIHRIHEAAHGFDSPCPTCAADTWLAQQRLLEELEQSAARAAAPATPRLPMPRPEIRRVA